ncbi:MAG: hypothetical protein U1F43_38040 [Myxococcota bacterium]
MALAAESARDLATAAAQGFPIAVDLAAGATADATLQDTLAGPLLDARPGPRRGRTRCGRTRLRHRRGAERPGRRRASLAGPRWRPRTWPAPWRSSAEARPTPPSLLEAALVERAAGLDRKGPLAGAPIGVAPGERAPVSRAGAGRRVGDARALALLERARRHRTGATLELGVQALGAPLDAHGPSPSRTAPTRPRS